MFRHWNQERTPTFREGVRRARINSLYLLLGRNDGGPLQLLQNSAIWTDSKHLPLFVAVLATTALNLNHVRRQLLA